MDSGFALRAPRNDERWVITNLSIVIPDCARSAQVRNP